MRTRIRLCPAFLLLVAGCASRDVSVIRAAPPRSIPCDLAVFQTEAEITRPFEKLCVIAVDEKPIGSGGYDREADGRARGKIEDAACKCGADGYVLRHLGRGNYRATAIAFVK